MQGAETARNLRTGFQKRPFDPILRLPDDL
ncbi:TFIIS-type domain-containing protein OS=Streptomyces antimycoticus OX=68175 GN=SSPO_035700 PE=4 SV=1 [Streptomyces antimycoticus]